MGKTDRVDIWQDERFLQEVAPFLDERDHMDYGAHRPGHPEYPRWRELSQQIRRRYQAAWQRAAKERKVAARHGTTDQRDG